MGLVAMIDVLRAFELGSGLGKVFVEQLALVGLRASGEGAVSTRARV